MSAYAHPASTVRFQVRPGMSAREIARDLHDNGLIHHRGEFSPWLKLLGHKVIHPGLYELSTRQSGLAIHRLFLQGLLRVRMTFPEGWTSKQMAALLETKGITPARIFSRL